jgi:hypothetical protein
VPPPYINQLASACLSISLHLQFLYFQLNTVANMQSEEFILGRLETGVCLVQQHIHSLECKVDLLNRKLDLVLAQFGVGNYVLDSRGFSSAANTGWSGPSSEAQFEGSSMFHDTFFCITAG